MNLSDALAKAVLGYRMWREGLGEGNYLYYNFNGFELVKGTFKNSEEDKAADWQVIGGEEIEPWPDFIQTNWNIEDALNKLDPEEPLDAIDNSNPHAVSAGWEMFNRTKGNDKVSSGGSSASNWGKSAA